MSRSQSFLFYRTYIVRSDRAGGEPSHRDPHRQPWAGVGRHLPRKEGVVPARQPWSDYQRGPGGDYSKK